MQLVRLLPVLTLAVLMVSGCAGTAAIECQGTDWYQLGQSHGILDARGEAERIATRCGNAFDRARYQEGFQEGFSRRARPMV
jgi:hypothetical protein